MSTVVLRRLVSRAYRCGGPFCLAPSGNLCRERFVLASVVSDRLRFYSVERKRRGVGYTQFGHGYKEQPSGTFAWLFPVGILFLLIWCSVEFRYKFRADAIALEADTDSEIDGEAGIPVEQAPMEPKTVEGRHQRRSSKKVDASDDKQKKKHVGFRDRRIIEYENRVRAYSTPDKMFRYFATLKVPHKHDATHYEVFMTPEDFVRSITPGKKQPDGLVLDQFKIYDPQKDIILSDLHKDSIFYKISQDGLISYPDFVFLLTVLSTSPKHFSIAFKMFDINGDGELDYNEFEVVNSIIRSQTTMGIKHRDYAVTGSVLKHSTSSGLSTYFFGPERDQKLSYVKFLSFQERLKHDVLFLEFQRREPENGRISEVSFSEMLLLHSGINEGKQNRMKKRIRKLCKEDPVFCPGVSFEELEQFFRFVGHISDVDAALAFYTIAGASIDEKTLAHVAVSVANISLSPHVLKVVFNLFDENQDGELSNKEFVNVMKERLMRGLEKPKDTGLIKLLSAVTKCVHDRTPEHHH